jgi:hypothetical protein
MKRSADFFVYWEITDELTVQLCQDVTSKTTLVLATHTFKDAKDAREFFWRMVKTHVSIYDRERNSKWQYTRKTDRVGTSTVASKPSPKR